MQSFLNIESFFSPSLEIILSISLFLLNPNSFFFGGGTHFFVVVDICKIIYNKTLIIVGLKTIKISPTEKAGK